jgi:type IV secretory pathway VirD2 relaxase
MWTKDSTSTRSKIAGYVEDKCVVHESIKRRVYMYSIVKKQKERKKETREKVEDGQRM